MAQHLPGPVLPTPGQLHEAFLWVERRTVTKTATVSLHSNTYEVDAALAGRRIELWTVPGLVDTGGGCPE